jgi:prepilin peptidase CpaA
MSNILIEIILFFALPVLLAAACFSDLFSMRISNKLCLSIFAMFVFFAGLASMAPSIVMWHILAGLCALVVSFGLFALGAIGGGDAKFVAAVAVWMGFSQLVEYLAIASVLGGFLTFAILIFRRYPLPPRLMGITWLNKLHDQKSGIPYGIALGTAAMMLLPFGEFYQRFI